MRSASCRRCGPTYFEFLDTKASLLTMIGIGGILGFVGMAWAVGFLGVAARGREAPMRKVILYVPIVGGVVVGISVLMAQIGTLTLTDDFLAGPRTVRPRGTPRTTSCCGRARCSSSGR